MSNNSNKRVVVVGGGFGGAAVARKLDSPNVTLVSDKPFLYIKFGGLRAAASGGAWVDRVQVPLEKIVRKGKLVIGRVTKIDAQAKKVVLEDGTAIEWDILVCATGSRSRGVSEPPESATTARDFKAYFDKTRAALASFQNVLVVGGGPIGVEFAGEIRTVQPNVNITLVTGKPGLLGSVQPAFPAKFIDSVTDALEQQNVKVVHDVVVEPKFDANAPFVVPADGKAKLASGDVVAADVIFFATGVDIRSASIYPPEWQDATTKELLVEPTYQVKGRPDVFALGDVAKSGRTKLGYLAAEDGGKVAANIKSLLAGKAPTSTWSVASSSLMVIPIGASHGRGYVFGVWGDWFVSFLKGQDLFTGKTWKDYTGEAPPPLPKHDEGSGWGSCSVQ